ncbi:MAG: hypothetical protein AAF657_12110 [Acidobacteriota bacterium]
MTHRISTLTLGLALTASIALSPNARAATLQVCGSCSYTTIQAAVDAAASGDMIEIAPGTYYESVSITAPGSLLLQPSSGRVTIDATGFDRALEILDPGAIVTLKDMDLTRADGWAGLVNHGHTTLATVHVMANSGTFGGIFNAGSLVTMVNSVIAGNTATALGSAGGLNNFAWVDLWNTTLLGNVGHEGGGFKTSGNSRVTVFASSISGNQASSMGGGYFNSSPQALVDIKASSSFSANSAAYCDTYYDVNQTPDCVN